MKYSTITLFVFISGLTFLTSCSESSSTNKEQTLFVSIEPQKALLEEIVGDKFEVVSILTPGSNPETFEPGMSVRRKLEDAATYFTIGYLPFENTLEDAVGKKVSFVNVSEGIIPVFGTHEHLHDHGHSQESDSQRKHHHDDGGADPHVWTSLKNARIIADNMYKYIVELDTANRDFYTQRYNRLINRIDSLDVSISQQLSDNLKTKSFAVWHPSLSYFARDYGLEQIAVGYENKELPPAALKKVIDEIREENVQVLFFQKEFDNRQAESLNKELGTEMIIINPMDYDWQKQFETIVYALCR